MDEKAQKEALKELNKSLEVDRKRETKLLKKSFLKMKYTHNKYKLINTKNTNELILNVEVYKCYKNKFVNSCDNEVTDFKKKNIKIDEVEIRKIGISGGIYNQVVYKESFGKNIYSYIKDTDYYRVIFKYKDGSKTYNIDYNFFTNVLQPEVL